MYDQVTLEAGGKFLAVVENFVVAVDVESPFTTFLLEVKDRDFPSLLGTQRWQFGKLVNFPLWFL